MLHTNILFIKRHDFIDNQFGFSIHYLLISLLLYSINKYIYHFIYVYRLPLPKQSRLIRESVKVYVF